MILFNSIFPGGLPLKDLIAYPNKVKFAKLGDSLLYDTLKELLYKDIIIRSIYDTESLPASGESITPNILVELPWARVGYSGNEYLQSNITNYTAVSYSARNPVEGFTLDTTTGEVTCSNNTTNNSRLFEVNVTITMDISGSVKNETVEIILDKGIKSLTEDIVNNELISTINYGEGLTKIPAKGGEATITTQAKLTKTIYTYWNNILTETTEEGLFSDVPATYSKTSGASVFKVNNNKVLITSGRGITLGADRNATIKASYDGLSTTVQCILEHNYIESIELTGGSITYGTTFNESGDTTLTPTITNNTATYIYTSESESTSLPNTRYGTVTRKSSFSLEQPMDGVTIDSTTGKITIPSNNTGSLRSITVIRTETVTWTPKTGYGEQRIIGTTTNKCTIIQDSVVIIESDWVVDSLYIFNPSPIPASGKEVLLKTQATQHKYSYKYKNGELESKTKLDDQTVDVIPKYTVTGTGFSIDGNTLIVESRGDEISDSIRKGIVTAEYADKTTSITVSQDANKLINVVTGWDIHKFYYPIVDSSAHTGLEGKVDPIIELDLDVKQCTLAGKIVDNSDKEIHVDASNTFLDLFTAGVLIYPTEFIFDYLVSDGIVDGAELYADVGAVTWLENTSIEPRLVNVGLYVCTGIDEYGQRKRECIAQGTSIQEGIIHITDTDYELVLYPESKIYEYSAASQTIDLRAQVNAYHNYSDGTEKTSYLSPTSITCSDNKSTIELVKNGLQQVVINYKRLNLAPNKTSVPKTTTVTIEYDTGSEILSKSINITQSRDEVSGKTNKVRINEYIDNLHSSGGSGNIIAKCAEVTTWVSGKEDIIYNDKLTPILRIVQGDGFTLQGTTLIASKNNTGKERLCKIVAEYPGYDSANLTIKLRG